MSRSQKVVLAVLALVAVLFLLAVGVGATRADCTGSPVDCERGGSGRGAMAALGALFGGGGLRLSPGRYEVRQGTTQRVDVPAGPRLAVLKIVLQSGDASQVAYVDRDPAALPHAPGDSPAPQAGTLPGSAGSPDAPRQASFTVTRAGGTLSLACTGPAACVFAQP